MQPESRSAAQSDDVTGEEDVEMAPLLDGAIEPDAARPTGSSSAAASAATPFRRLVSREITVDEYVAGLQARVDERRWVPPKPAWRRWLHV